MPRWVIWGFVILSSACSQASPFPDMQPGETGRVVNVIDGDMLVLDTGQGVRLVSIESPALYPRDRDADPFAAEGARILEDLTLGRRVQLYYPGITRDRYDRALAHVVTIDGAGPETWLNAAMLERGAAWVRDVLQSHQVTGVAQIRVGGADRSLYFKADRLDVTELGSGNAAAVKAMDRAGWK